MLILTRKVGQKLRIGDDCEITVLDVKGRQVRIGIVAPKGVPILREEVLKRIEEENVRATQHIPSNAELDKLFEQG